MATYGTTYNTAGTNTAGTTTAPATGGRRFGRRKATSSGPSALVKNELKKPATKMTEWRTKSGERWGVARARIQESVSRLGASMSYRAFSCTHPLHPIRRRAAKDAEAQKKDLAKERRVQQEAAVHSNAAGKRAQAHESRIATLNQAV
ncbi:unnamed protein product [Calypogeia fissa]